VAAVSKRGGPWTALRYARASLLRASGVGISHVNVQARLQKHTLGQEALITWEGSESYLVELAIFLSSARETSPTRVNSI
jgi:hypothetical protein